LSLNLKLEAQLEAAIGYHEARDPRQAEYLCREILRMAPDHADTLNLLGLAVQDLGRPDESISLIRRAIALDPGFSDAHANLARGFNFLAKPNQAAEAARVAIELDPFLAEGWLQLGRASLELGDNAAAIDALRRAAELLRNVPDIHAGIGYAAQRLGDYAAAADAWRRVLDSRPDEVVALVNLGAALFQLGQLDEAATLHRRAVHLAPDDVTALGALAGTLHGRFEAAEGATVAKRLLELDPERPDILTILAACLTWLGHFVDAAESCEAALAIQPDHIPARHLLATLKPESMDAATIASFRTRMDDPSLPPQDRASAGFAVAKALDKAGDPDEAFRVFRAANALYHADGKAQGRGFNLVGYQAFVDWARAAFTPAVFAEAREMGNPSELPVFIVGMPRSGTSLVEQIIASHPRVHGAGERKDIMHILTRLDQGTKHRQVQMWDREQVARETEQHLAHLRVLDSGADRVVDKMPDNINVLGQIRTLFPNAHIIVCRRDLRDVCVSCVTTHFGTTINWAWDVKECASRAVETDRLLDHWRLVLPGPVMEVSYEALISNPEAESRRLIEFLGLPWDPACLSFHETERAVTTASAQQVRVPVFTSSIGRWRRYGTHLGEMSRILGDRGPDPGASCVWEAPETAILRRAQMSGNAQDFPAAIRLLRDGVRRFPGNHDLVAPLAFFLGMNSEFQEAAIVWRRALALRPERIDSLANLGLVLAKADRISEAITIFREAIARQPASGVFHKFLGRALLVQKEWAEARRELLFALDQAPNDLELLVPLGSCELSLGLFDDAASRFRRALELEPGNQEAVFGLTFIGRPVANDEIGALSVLLADPARPEGDRIWSGHALGRTREKAGDYDGAFEAYQAANQLTRESRKRTRMVYDPVEHARWVNDLIRGFTPEFFRATAGSGNPSELPVYIVGVPRSGTTLVEQILASHPKVCGGGEREGFADTIQAMRIVEGAGLVAGWNPLDVKREAAAEIARLRALDETAERVTDKLPGNVFWLGHIRILLPNARFIAVRRDPRDIGLSCFFSYFVHGHEWSTDLADIAAQIRETDRIIAHWRNVLPGPFMEIQYEDIVADLEGQSRRLIDFAGLEWDPACLEFHRNERAISTASQWQVRQKLYASSVGRWRRYERHLGPLLDGVRDLIR
jgi:tetratricopeptide (TPR) repeat protein